MNAEIIAVGSELLLGQITNSNARFISSQLAEIGINVYYHTVVGDNPNRLLDAITIAENRSDLIIFSGGLGPTKDDLTKETIAKHLHIELEEDMDAMKSIVEFFQNQNKPMTENNRKQALVLKGSHVLANKNGMAPGMMYTASNHTYILLPGPPKEIEPMFQFEAKPLLTSLVLKGQIVSHVLRFYGIGEAELEDKLQHLLENQTNPTLAPLASDGEVTIRITANADTTEEAWKKIRVAKEEILHIAGDYFYGVDDDSISSVLTKMLMKNELTIAAAESLTAGLFQAELANNPGVGEALLGGMVTYNEQVKINQLGMAKEVIEQHGVVSSECASEMARLVKEKFGSTIGVGLTGAAGPQAHGNKPAGTVWIGIAIGDEPPHTYRLQLSGSRNTNRLRATKSAFYRLIQLLIEKGYERA